MSSNFKSAKIWIMFLFYVLIFFKKGDIIQGRTLFKEIQFGNSGGLSKNFHGVGICPLSKILAVRIISILVKVHYKIQRYRDKNILDCKVVII